MKKWGGAPQTILLFTLFNFLLEIEKVSRNSSFHVENWYFPGFSYFPLAIFLLTHILIIESSLEIEKSEQDFIFSRGEFIFHMFFILFCTQPIFSLILEYMFIRNWKKWGGALQTIFLLILYYILIKNWKNEQELPRPFFYWLFIKPLLELKKMRRRSTICLFTLY